MKKNVMEQQQNWRRLNGTMVTSTIEAEVRTILLREKHMGHPLKVCIGTDSQVKGKDTDFATVIVFIRKGKGGFMYVLDAVTKRKLSIKERMLLEVSKSVAVAHALSSLFNAFEVEMEVHADINTSPNFKSYEALKEATGYIVGMGFTFIAKPHAFASSSCANKFVQ